MLIGCEWVKLTPVPLGRVGWVKVEPVLEGSMSDVAAAEDVELLLLAVSRRQRGRAQHYVQREADVSRMRHG